tara:strand:+ start:423 stop:683 length:261 start_codon:yes stop_codon:yes gene_type:complete
MNWFNKAWNQRDNKKQLPKKGKANYDSKLADKDIKYCPTCRVCWEWSYQSSKLYVERYKDFVGYGKIKQVCTMCIAKKGEKKNEQG